MPDKTETSMRPLLNTLIRYRRLPESGSLSSSPSDCLLLATNPVIRYNRKTKRLTIKGPDVNLAVRANRVEIGDG
jgi:hypothetical protein